MDDIVDSIVIASLPHIIVPFPDKLDVVIPLMVSSQPVLYLIVVCRTVIPQTVLVFSPILR